MGNDTDGSASSSAMTYAIRDAVDVYHVKIINLSMGTWSEYHDGSDQICQAVDYATSQGTTVFVAAGNEATGVGIIQVQSRPRALRLIFRYIYLGESGYSGLTWFGMMVWDEMSPVNMQYFNSSHMQLNPLAVRVFRKLLKRSTQILSISIQLTPQNSGTYYFRVQNNIDTSQFFIFIIWDRVFSLLFLVRSKLYYY